MKKTIYTAAIGLMLIPGFRGSAQNLYSLDLSNPSTYSIDCGTVNAGQWRVRNNHCSLITSYIQIPGRLGSDTNMVVPITVTIKSTGNLSCGEMFPDGAFIRYSVNSGRWYVIRRITACEFVSNINVTANHTVCVPAGSNLRIKVSLANDDFIEKLWVLDRDIVVGAAAIADSTNWYFRMLNPNAQNPEISNDEKIALYPNPANNVVTLEVLQPMLLQNGDVYIYNIQGQLIMQQVINNEKTEINIAQLQQGIYFVRLGSSEGAIIKKFIKE
ncbi:MAG: T9SS type A sorting domain-containing protein [Bacteroidales bacterium]